MAFKPVSEAELGLLLRQYFDTAVSFQGSGDTSDFDRLVMRKVSSSQGSNTEFMLKSSLGSAGVQWVNPASSGNYPKAQSIAIARKVAQYKEIDATVSVLKSVWDAAMRSPSERFFEPLAEEVESKAIAYKRRMAASLYGDGTGVIGQVASASAAAGQLVINLNASNSGRGHVGFFEYEDILVLKSISGATSVIDTNLATEPAYWGVVEINRQLNQVKLKPLDAAGIEIPGLVSLSTPPAVGEVFYPYAQPTILDLSSPIVDFGSATEVLAGYESLMAFDGRQIHGIKMSGATGTTHRDGLGGLFDSTQIQALMTQVKTRVGKDRYKYDSIVTAPEAYDLVINAGEVDRRFMVVDNIKRGSKMFVYQHLSDTLEMVTSEFCPKTRAYIIPAAEKGKSPLELRMTAMEDVAVGGVSSHLGVGAQGHTRSVNKYMTASGTLINKHPAACGVLTNFILA